MFSDKYQKISEWFNTQIGYADNQIQYLTEESRGDEAVFIKVRKNILDIFRTVLYVSEKSGQSAPDFFLARLHQIPQNWHASMLAARAHGDAEKAYLEQLKINTAEEIRQVFIRIMEDET